MNAGWRPHAARGPAIQAQRRQPARTGGLRVMPTFTYEAMNVAGQEVKDQIEATSTEDAIAKIRNLGYFPTKIKQKGGAKVGKAGAKGPAKKKGGGGGINIGGVSVK